MVVSTLHLRLAFCKLATAADSETKKELLLALGLDNISEVNLCYANIKDTLRQLDAVDFIFLNKIYVKYTDSIDDNFIRNSSEVFGVRVDKVGFNYPQYAATFINKWVDDASLKRIGEIIGPNDITKDTSIFIVTATHLKTTWEFPFDIRFTADARFHHLDNKVSFIPMMTKTDSFLYFHEKTNDFQILKMLMGPADTSVTFVVPQDASLLPALLNKFYWEPTFLKNVKDLMRYTYIRVRLPRFKINTSFDWTELLQQFVSKQIFNTTYSGLAGMLNKDNKTKNVYLSKAKQNNFMSLDEMGSFRYIEGLMVPFMSVTVPPASPTQQDFLADRPFYFTVDLEPKSGEHYELFHGVFYGTK